MDIEQLARLTPGDWYHDVRDQLKWHVYRRSEAAFARGDAERDRLSDPDEVRARQQRIRDFFISSLGGLPIDAGPAEARVMGVVKRAGYRIEKLVYESRPCNYVTSLLYVPDDLNGRAPAVLFLCGHAAEGKGYPEYQRVCQLLALHGFVVLAQDPIGQGERLSYWEPDLNRALIGACTLEHDHAGAQCVPLGWALARFFLHDARRSLDYLAARPEVDPERIGVTGNSGGGTQSCLLMLSDTRLAAAAPGTFIMNRQTYMNSGGAQDAEQIWPGFTAAGFDHEDVLIAMAPKPVCVLAVTDDFFPIEGTRRTVERCRHVWERFGVPGMPELVVDRAGHAYTPTLARASVRFFARHLMGSEVEPDYERTAALPCVELWCTKTGQVRSEFADASSVHEACLAKLDEVAAERATRSPQARLGEARDWLRQRVHHGRAACDLNTRSYWSGHLDDLSVRARIWWSQPDLMGHGLEFVRSGDEDPDRLPCTIAVWDGGTDRLEEHHAWIRRTCRAGRAVLVLDVSGVGALRPHALLAGTSEAEFYGVIHKLADDLMWLGDSLCALRTYDVLRAVDMVTEPATEGRRDVRVYADGRSGRQCIYGILAAFLDDRIAGIDLEGEPPTWSDWVRDRMYVSRHIKAVILPGALTHFDTDECA
ncbi:MAG: hypothetical protein GX446_08560 [Chthonomonadales bacterium]|nr:hypothetical protein [Chthonomonadales bacterium]